MSHSIEDELKRVDLLFIESNPREAFEILDKLEKKSDLTSVDRINCYLFRSQYLSFFQESVDDLNYAEKAYQLSIKTKNQFQILQSLNSIAIAHILAGNVKKAQDFISKSENLLNQTVTITPTENKRIRARINLIKGYIHRVEGDFDKTLEYYKRSLKLYKELDNKLFILFSLWRLAWFFLRKMEINEAKIYAEKCLSFQKTLSKRSNARIMNLQGAIYATTGELDVSIKFYELGLKLAEEDMEISQINLIRLNLGSCYLMQGDFNRSLKSFEEGLAFFEEIGSQKQIFEVLWGLFCVKYEMKSFDEAQRISNRMEQINEQVNHTRINQMYSLIQAMMLKIDRGSRNRIKAEDILKQLLNEKIVDPGIFELAFLHLADLLLFEIKLNGSLENFNELHDLYSKVLKIAEQQKKYNLIAKVKLLQSQMALLNFEFKDAQHFLSHAQKIADKHGLHLLARRISIEHDKLLEDMNLWEKLKKDGIPLAERLNLSQINEKIESMVQKRINTPQELETEESIMLIIMREGGIPLFSHIFEKKWEMDDTLFSGFMSAINSFGSEIFSESVDRIKFGDYTILLKSNQPFTICYTIKGQSYPAQQKLTKFSEDIKNDSEIWKILNRSMITGNVLTVNEPKSLGTLIELVFPTI